MEEKLRASTGPSSACVGLGAASFTINQRGEVLSGHFQNSLEDDCKPAVADLAQRSHRK